MLDLGQVPAGFAGLRELHRGQTVDEAPIGPLLAFVDARLDCADFRALTAAKLALDHAQQLCASSLDAIGTSLRGFKYWFDEPGTDSMCYWSENHQVIFATVQYLAGGLWPAAAFPNAGLTGSQHRARGRRRLARWLADRQTFGFSEWLSNVYYEEDIAALALLVDHGAPDLAASARGVLDVAMLELAAHSSGGVLGAASGRTYEQQRKFPATAQVSGIMAHAFGIEPAVDLDWSGLSALFYSSSYRPPAGLVELATSPKTWTVKTAHGVDLTELRESLDDRTEEEAAEFAWGMEAFVNPETVRATRLLMRRHSLNDNAFLSPLRLLSTVPGPLLPALMRLANPFAQGMALQRADVVTWRSEFGTLSSAQRYRPGEFGDQQQIWQATLGEVGVFATHPTGDPKTFSVRNATPNEWVGNALNPDVAQHENLLVARYDTHGRRGLLEPPRRRCSHLYWPMERFDESLTGRDWLAARVGGGLIGVRAAANLRQGGEEERVQDGAITGWAVRLQAVEGGAGELVRFASQIAESTLFVDRYGLRWFSAWGALELPVRGAFTVNGRVHGTRYRRSSDLMADGWAGIEPGNRG